MNQFLIVRNQISFAGPNSVLPHGTKVQPDGTIVLRNGLRVRLSDGLMVSFSGVVTSTPRIDKRLLDKEFGEGPGLTSNDGRPGQGRTATEIGDR